MAERLIEKATSQGDVVILEGLELIARTGHRDHPIAHERADRIIAALTMREAVLALHYPETPTWSGNGSPCVICRDEPWPCRTVTACGRAES